MYVFQICSGYFGGEKAGNSGCSVPQTVQTSYGAHPATCSVGTGYLPPVVKRPERKDFYSCPYSAVVTELSPPPLHVPSWHAQCQLHHPLTLSSPSAICYHSVSVPHRAVIMVACIIVVFIKYWNSTDCQVKLLSTLNLCFLSTCLCLRLNLNFFPPSRVSNTLRPSLSTDSWVA